MDKDLLNIGFIILINFLNGLNDKIVTWYTDCDCKHYNEMRAVSENLDWLIENLERIKKQISDDEETKNEM